MPTIKRTEVEVSEIPMVARAEIMLGKRLMVLYRTQYEMLNVLAECEKHGVEAYVVTLDNLERGVEIKGQVTLVSMSLLPRFLFGQDDVVQEHALCIIEPGRDISNSMQAYGRFSKGRSETVRSYYLGSLPRTLRWSPYGEVVHEGLAQ